jgi:hypothetical protein
MRGEPSAIYDKAEVGGEERGEGGRGREREEEGKRDSVTLKGRIGSKGFGFDFQNGCVPSLTP